MLKMSKNAVRLIAGIATTAGLCTGALAVTSEAPPTETQKHAMNMAMDLSLAFEHASETIEDSVVHIITEQDNRRGFRQQTGLGSGVIADERGYILTNAHVVDAGQFIKVRLSDGRELPGELIGTFSETDIAVVKIEADNLKPAVFGDSEGLRVGQWVLAIGSPFGFQQSVTAGIVSAKGRGSVNMSGSSEGNMPQRFQEFIQTDAAINPGNSGGPLVDLNGYVIGINTAILSRSGGNNGLGFAIPIDIAGAVMNRLIQNGRVDRGWMGVQMGELMPAEAYNLGIDGGVLLELVVDDGPAARAGLKVGDIVTALGGRATENVVRMGNAIMLSRPGVPVEVQYLRDGKKRAARAILQDRDEQRAIAAGGAFIENLGFLVAPDEQRVTQRGRVIDRIPGYRVLDVTARSTADESGLEPGDFLYEIDGRLFENSEQLSDFFANANYEEGVRLKLIRGNARGYIDITEDDE